MVFCVVCPVGFHSAMNSFVFLMSSQHHFFLGGRTGRARSTKFCLNSPSIHAWLSLTCPYKLVFSNDCCDATQCISLFNIAQNKFSIDPICAMDNFDTKSELKVMFPQFETKVIVSEKIQDLMPN